MFSKMRGDLRSRPTAGYETLLQAGRHDLSYEKVVVEHVEEFSATAVWYARNALGLANELPEPPNSIREPKKWRSDVVDEDITPELEDRYWVLICNPQKWAIDRFLRTGSDVGTWGVRPYDREKFAPGQLAVIRVGLDRRSAAELAGAAKLASGIYAVCQIESEAFDATGAGDAFWADGEKREPGWPTVQIRYLCNLINQPLSIERLREEAPETSRYLRDGFQASTMPISGSDFHSVLRLLGKTTDDLPAPPDCDVTFAQLAALEERYRRASPEVRSRVSRSIERGRVGALAKKMNGFRCLLCEAHGQQAIGFRKPNGEPYVEAHHVMPVARGQVGSLAASNIMTLCANHHRQMHYGDVIAVIEAAHFDVVLDGTKVCIPRLTCDGTATS